VSAFHAGFNSAYFFEEDNGYTVPQNFTANATETVYVEVDASLGGTIRIRVTSP
jgi:hypothetical protein